MAPPAPPDRAAPPPQAPFQGDVDDASDDAAIDDTDDVVDDEFADLARTLSAKRREEKEKGRENRIQEILPFPFAPNIRPLGISDLQSVVALENAAFAEPQHRASPEKVCSPASMFISTYSLHPQRSPLVQTF
jgi:hypothetical protein